MPEIPDTTAAHDERVRPLLDKLDQLAQQRDGQATTPKPHQRLLSDENAHALALILAPVLVNMAAAAALRRLTRGLADAGLPVRPLDRREARRIAWPAMTLLRIVSGALRPSRELTRTAAHRERDQLAEMRDLAARRARQTAGRTR